MRFNIEYSCHTITDIKHGRRLSLQLMTRGCASRSPEASETQLGRVKAICDLARLASGIIVVISVFNSLLNNVFLDVYGMARAHGVLVCVRYYTHTLSDT